MKSSSPHPAPARASVPSSFSLRGLSLLLVLGCLALGASPATGAQEGQATQRPNILMVMVDDMGYGDLSMAGNTQVQTPHLDAMATRSASFESFYVLPVCGLTRAALMSGRYPHRVGVHMNGRSLRRGTPTIASELQAAGYATGIFGKWHLGDHYPYRPVDFGFEKSVVTRGGVIGQLADEPNLVRYTNPFLMTDGKLKGYEGYATDVHFELTLRWMEEVHAEGRPFFAFLSTNAPHKPYDDVPEEAYGRLRGKLLGEARAELKPGKELDRKQLKALDDTARCYAMVERLDENMGRLFARLEENGLLEETLVLFFSDNGPVPGRFNAGLRGGKGGMHEGGLKTHFFAHWPGKLSPSIRSDRIAAHIDLFPTLLEACGVELGTQVDGVSLWPILTGETQEAPERLLFFEAHQGRGAARQNFAVRSQDYKLVLPGGYGGATRDAGFELYDMRVDPLETNNLADSLPEIVERLDRAYDPFAEEIKAILLAARRNELRVEVGSSNYHPQLITRAHWKRTQADNLNSTWQLAVTDPGSYRLRMIFKAKDTEREVRLTLNRREHATLLPAGERSVDFEDMQLIRGANIVECNVVERKGRLMPAWQMELLRTGELTEPEPERATNRQKPAKGSERPGKGRRKRELKRDD